MRLTLRVSHNLGRIFALVFISLLFAVACGASSSPSNMERALRSPLGGDIKVLKWGVWSVNQPRTIRVVGEVSHCAGYPKPRIKRPHIRYQGTNVYIRLMVEMPRYEQGAACGSLGAYVRRSITLNRDLADVKIYDSGTKPPRLRWPD